MFELDSQEKIVLAKTYSIIGKYFGQAISESGDGERILCCAGLSSLVDDYRTELTPYYMNGTWKNESGRKGNRDAKIRIGRSPHYGGDYGHRSRGERTQCIGHDHRKRRTFRSGSATPAQRACRSWR